jgi:V8-like Glu-specific endopeptidase
MKRTSVVTWGVVVATVSGLCGLQACAEGAVPIDDAPVHMEGDGAHYVDAEAPVAVSEHALLGSDDSGEHLGAVPEDEVFDHERLELYSAPHDEVAATSQALVFDREPVRVADTTTAARRTTVQLLITWTTLPDRRVCSGVLLAPDAVLTAAHCIYNKSRGGWAYSVEVAPARNGPSRPYGRAYGKRLFTPAKYRELAPDVRKLTYDYAVVRLKTAFTLKGAALYSKAAASGAALALRGYPSHDASHMYEARDSVRRLFSDGVFWHRAGTYTGMSGAPIMDGSGVFGVHVGGTADGQWNNGVLFGVDATKEVKSWATRVL